MEGFLSGLSGQPWALNSGSLLVVTRANDTTLQILRVQQAQRASGQCAFFLADKGEPGPIVESGPIDATFEDPQDPRTSDHVSGRFG